jgi:hypothetical protein
MEFKEVMKQVETLFKEWEKDEVLTSMYETKEELQREFLQCIQEKIGSSFEIITKSAILDYESNEGI